MKTLRLKKAIIVLFVLAFPIFICQKSAFSFDVNWAPSWDNGLYGYQQVALWLVNNHYYSNLSDAENFGKNGYIGKNSNDPFFWNLPQGTEVEIVQEIAGYKNLTTFGYYTGSSISKGLTQLLGGTENGPKTFTINENFGFYINTPKHKYWYTDRAENIEFQSGHEKENEAGGDPQALIYELKQGRKWLIAWEDLDATSGVTERGTDNDYNDMYVTVTAAPEPISSALFLLGGGALVALKLRKKK